MSDSYKNIHGYVKSGDFSLCGSKITDIGGRYRICFTGNILNIKEISEQLASSDPPSEAEKIEKLISRCYLKWGEGFASGFKGSFLIVIFDLYQEILLIITDHFGKIPLYYTRQDSSLYFSNSLRSLTSNYPVSTEYSPESLNFYFALRYIPGERTIFTDVYKLPPSSVLSFNHRKNTIDVNRYWKFPVEDPPTGDEDELSSQFENILREVVKSRMDSGVSCGAFLSGGIDSSLIVALMSEFSSEPVNTFTIGFDEQKFDERKYANIVSDYFKTNHNELEINPSMTEHFEKLPELLEEPLGDPSIIPTYYSYKMSSEICKNMFCGEGADGLLLGLKTHMYTDQYSRVYNRFGFLLNLLAPLGKRLPDSFKWKIAIEGLSPEQFFLRRSMMMGENERFRLFSDDLVKSLGMDINNPEKRAAGILGNYNGSLKGKMSYYNSSTVVDNALAMRVNLARYFSIGYLTPFLDTELVSFILNRVHPDLRIKNGVAKYLLKKVAKKYLPETLPMERKTGFNPPFSKWFRNEWWNLARERTLDADLDFINREYVESLFKRHKENVTDEGRKIYSLLVLSIWHSNYKI